MLKWIMPNFILVLNYLLFAYSTREFVQSGGVYDLKVSTMSSDKKLAADIICSLGVRYLLKSYYYKYRRVLFE
jgi:nucleosome binding factor SPN SPT16 subunit